jgi:AAA+ ATPase superfamily predicted ATPase
MVDWWQQENLIKLESPTSIFIVAPSNSGKTVLAKNILKQTDGSLKYHQQKYCSAIPCISHYAMR